MKDSRSLSILFLGGRAYPVRHYPIAIRLRDRKGRAILCIAFNPQSGDSSDAILEVPFKALLHGVPSAEKNRKQYKSMRKIKIMKSYTKAQLADAAGVSVATFRRWLKTDEAYLHSQGIQASAKLLPPHVVRYLCEKYCIDL